MSRYACMTVVAAVWLAIIPVSTDSSSAESGEMLEQTGSRGGPINVLFYSEQDLGPSAYQQALTDLGWDTLATFTNNATDFANFLDAGGWTHVISNHTATAAPAGFEDSLATFALANPGTPVLISDWRISNPQPYLAALGFAYGVDADYASISAVPGELFDGFPPAAIVDPGWGSLYAVETAGATQIATSSLGGGAVQQNGNWFFNGFLGDVFADTSLGSAYIQRELLVNTGVTVIAVSPAQYDYEGGSPIVISGSGFSSDLEVTINDQTLTALTLVNSTAMTGLVPANPVGTYDLVVKDSVSHIIQATLPNSVEYIISRLPPPEDVSAILVATGVQLNWSNPTFNDLIRVKRDGLEVAVLPGDATEFLDYFGYPPTSSIPYEISAEAGARSSTEAEATAASVRAECLPFLAEGASGSEYGDFFPLPPKSKARLCFHLDNNVNGLGFRVGLRRINRLGRLWAEISTVDDPPIILDTVEFSSIPASLSTYTWATSHVPLALGDYVVSIYTTEYDPDPCDPGVTCTPSFELMPDAFYVHPDSPCPESDYPYAPLLDIWPFCDNVPPAVTDITISLPVNIEWIDPDRLRAGGGEESTLLRTLTVEAQDPDGTIDHFIWLIRYKGEEECTLNEVDPNLRPCNATEVSAGNSILHEFPFKGMWSVVVIAEDDAGDRGMAERHFPIFPARPSPPCGAGPGISDQMPNTEVEGWLMRYIPAIKDTFLAASSTAVQEFAAMVRPADCSPPPLPGGYVPIETVEMELLDPDTLIGLGPVVAEEDPDGFMEENYAQSYFASFNMGALPHTDLAELRVTATGEDANQRMQPWDVPLCTMPEIFDYDDHPVDLIETTLIYYPSPKKHYDLTATIPDFKILDDTIHVPLVNVDLRNVLDAHVTFNEYLEDKWWTPQNLEGRFQATLLGFDLFPTQEFDLYLEDFNAEIACDDFEIKYELLDITIYQSDPMIWEILPRTTLYNGFVGPVHVRVSVSLDVGMDFGVSADISAFVRAYQVGGEPAVEITFVSTPTVEAWATGELRVEVFWGLASASVRLRPSISVCLPIIINGEAPPIPLALGVSLDWGFNLGLDINIRGCAFGCISSGWITLFNEPFGAGCGGARQATLRGGVEEASDLMYPSIAISPDGLSSMAVFVNNCVAAPGEYLPELYYTVDSGAGYSAPPDPILIAPNELTERDTSVVFTSNDQAIAVWTQGLLTHAEESALPQTPAGANTGFKNSDIYFAVWDGILGTWDPPQPLYEDTVPPALIPDGRPVVAPFVDNVANPNAAWVVWVRSDNEDMIYEAAGGGHVAGDADLSGMSIYAHKILAGAPSGALIKISAGDEADPAADIQPTVALSPSGDVALAVWVRDQDSDFDTPEDRFLMSSVWFGGAWQPATAITDPTELPGVLMPNVTLSSDDDGMLVFTARDIYIDGSPMLYEGNKDIVYAIQIIDAVFQSAVPLEHRPARNPDTPIKHLTDQVLVTRPVYGRQPQVRYLDPSTAAVVFRSFDGFGKRGGDGEIGIATIDLSQPDAKWCYARDLTDDEDRDWDITAAVDPSGIIRTVRDSSAGDPDFCGLAFDDIACIPDLMVDRALLSYPHTPPGNSVTLTAVLRNNGLCTSQDTQTHQLHIGRVVDEVFEPITDPIEFIFNGVAPEETLTFSYTFLAPIETTHLRVIADQIQQETELTNNSADVILGVLPPTDLQCTVIPSDPRPTVRLDWENSELYDLIRVYRNGRLSAEVRADSTAYLDTTVKPGDHEWSVRGKIGLALSDPQGAVVACTVECAIYADVDGDGDADLNDLLCLLDGLRGLFTCPGVTFEDLDIHPCADGNGDINLYDLFAVLDALAGISPCPDLCP